MWIMLIAKLPTAVSPPKLSIFWAEPWKGEVGEKMYRRMVLDAWCREQGKVRTLHRRRDQDDYDLELWEECAKAIADGDFVPPNVEEYRTGRMPALIGAEPNWAGAVAILYGGEKIRVFPHEYSKLADERLKEYVAESHELVLGDTVESEQLSTELEISPEKQALVDAALLEGASLSEAKLMACGLYSPEEGTEVKPSGWYRCKREYAEVYCTEREMAENRAPAEA
jgi:hypothetical protein